MNLQNGPNELKPLIAGSEATIYIRLPVENPVAIVGSTMLFNVGNDSEIGAGEERDQRELVLCRGGRILTNQDPMAAQVDPHILTSPYTRDLFCLILTYHFKLRLFLKSLAPYLREN